MGGYKVFDSRKYYDSWAKGYERSWYLGFWYWELLDKTLRNIPLDNSGKLLDLGCGTGIILHKIHQQYDGLGLYGIDISEVMLEQARLKFANSGKEIFLKCGDISEKLPWDDNTFDYVISTYSFHHSKEPVGTLGEIRRVLKPSGVVCIAELCFPPVIHTIANVVVRVAHLIAGCIRYYNRREMLDFFRRADFNSIHQVPLNPYATITFGRK